MRQRRAAWWIGSAVAAVVVLIATPLVVVGVFGLPGGGSDTDKRVAAVLALAGTMSAALVSLIGVIVERHSARRVEQQRADEEARLRLEAAMRAGELLNARERPADPAAVASGLLALTRLDRADLAVALLVDLWDMTQKRNGAATSAAQVSDETAILVLDAALASGRPNAQLVAAELLCRNAQRLDICQSLHWPASIDGAWNPDFGPKTKLLLIDALVQLALKSTKREAALQSLAVRLYGVSEGDPDPHVQGCVGKLLAAIVPEFADEGTIMQGPREVTFSALRHAASKAQDNPDRHLSDVAEDRAAKLRMWAKSCHMIDYAPGALAAAPQPA
jgi:hypothetical protein